MEVDALLKKTKANRNFYKRVIFLEESFINLKCDCQIKCGCQKCLFQRGLAVNIVADSEIISANLCGPSTKES